MWVWLSVWSCAGGSRFWAKNTKPSVHCSVSGVPCETVMWDNAWRWWVRVDEMEAAGGLCIRQREARWRDLGQKIENRASVAWFQTRHVKWEYGVMLGVGGCELMRWRQWGGCTFANARPGSGIWAKKSKAERLWLGFRHAV